MNDTYIERLRLIKLGQIEKEKKKPVPIKPVSKKREVLQREYRALVKSMLQQNPNCEIMATGCTGKAQGMHHKEKRSEHNLCNPENLLRACNNCNLYIENNPLEAIEKGLSKSKHIKQKQ